jgi:hypothetical protein
VADTHGGGAGLCGERERGDAIVARRIHANGGGAIGARQQRAHDRLVARLHRRVQRRHAFLPITHTSAKCIPCSAASWIVEWMISPTCS